MVGLSGSGGHDGEKFLLLVWVSRFGGDLSYGLGWLLMLRQIWSEFERIRCFDTKLM